MSYGSEIEGNKTFSLSKITEDKVDQLVEIIRHNLDPFEEAGSVLAATYRRLSNFWKIYNSEGSGYWTVVNRHTGRLVGGAGIGPFVGLSPKDKIGEIRELVIEEGSRGQGAGTMLLTTCLEFAKKQDYTRVYLETTPQMKRAQELFRRFNFQPVTEQADREETGSNGLPCYFMLNNEFPD